MGAPWDMAGGCFLRVGRGPFKNQVCFYPFIGGSSSIPTRSGLNPFENQVSFYYIGAIIRNKGLLEITS